MKDPKQALQDLLAHTQAKIKLASQEQVNFSRKIEEKQIVINVLQDVEAQLKAELDAVG